MKLVDSAAEQDVLEILLEQGKPPQPLTTTGLEYLRASPFRYPSYPAGSRFRAGDDPGVFYGAHALRTAAAAAELGYWRWRFLLDSPGLLHIGPVSHTAFRIKLDASAIDLRAPPLDMQSGLWAAARDDSVTQAIARTARSVGLQAVIYQSVRDPERDWCAAVLSPYGFAARKLDSRTQSWWLTTTRAEIVWRRVAATMSFRTDDWR